MQCQFLAESAHLQKYVFAAQGLGSNQQKQARTAKGCKTAGAVFARPQSFAGWKSARRRETFSVFLFLEDILSFGRAAMQIQLTELVAKLWFLVASVLATTNS
jgi:hypothetical protein